MFVDELCLFVVGVITFVAFIVFSVFTGLAITEEIQFMDHKNQIAAISGLGFCAAATLVVYSTIMGIVLVDTCYSQPLVSTPWIIAFTLLCVMTIIFGFGFAFYPNDEDLGAEVGIGFGMIVSLDTLLTGIGVFCRLQTSQPLQQTPHIPPRFPPSPITCEDTQDIEQQG